MNVTPLLAILLAATATAQAPAPKPAPPPPNASAPVPDATPAAPAPQPPHKLKLLVSAQVLLDRANFPPGVIDGTPGSNFGKAVMAYKAANKLPVTPAIDQAFVDRLAKADPKPVLARYTIAEEDVAGPFEPKSSKYTALAERKKLGWSTPLEGIAEKSHADETFLKRLNPGKDFTKAGEEIIVPAVGRQPLPAQVTRVEVRKKSEQALAFGADGKLLAVYPSTIGGGDLPSPEGTVEVTGVTFSPVYTYDPERLTDKRQGLKKLELPGGPNNPVGVVWIGLNKPTYGIHGTPEPRLIGKRQSHGCVRLTNWDAWQLGKSIDKGAVVTFVDA
jgi:lipoprotein-anchoring transpeptidase ErfK/SrfK